MEIKKQRLSVLRDRQMAPLRQSMPCPDKLGIIDIVMRDGDIVRDVPLERGRLIRSPINVDEIKEVRWAQPSEPVVDTPEEETTTPPPPEEPPTEQQPEDEASNPGGEEEPNVSE